MEQQQYRVKAVTYSCPNGSETAELFETAARYLRGRPAVTVDGVGFGVDDVSQYLTLYLRKL